MKRKSSYKPQDKATIISFLWSFGINSIQLIND